MRDAFRSRYEEHRAQGALLRVLGYDRSLQGAADRWVGSWRSMVGRRPATRPAPKSGQCAGHAAPAFVSVSRISAIDTSNAPAVSSRATVGVVARSCAAKHDSGTARVV